MSRTPQPTGTCPGCGHTTNTRGYCADCLDKPEGEAMSNTAFGASEARWLAEDEGMCPQHGVPTDSWGYCGACDDEAYEYACADSVDDGGIDPWGDAA